MSAPEPAPSTAPSLLVVVDPVARRLDGESVRIAKDVLSAAATVKICLPQGPEEFARALARRGSRRPVVIGDDRALLRAVAVLHRERELDSAALSMVPVGTAVGLCRALGLPTDAVTAARTVLDGAEQRLDLLVDDSDGVVLGDLRIPPTGPEAPSGQPPQWLRTCRTLVRTLASRPAGPAPSGPPSARLRVETDGVTLIDLDQPVEGISVTPTTSGLAHVEVRTGRPYSVGSEASVLVAEARTVTVSGPDFRYRADTLIAGPVRRRTWTVLEGAWALTLPVPVALPEL